MQTNFTPILVVPAIPCGKKIRFLRHDGQIEINAQISDTV